MCVRRAIKKVFVEHLAFAKHMGFISPAVNEESILMREYVIKNGCIGLLTLV